MSQTCLRMTRCLRTPLGHVVPTLIGTCRPALAAEESQNAARLAGYPTSHGSASQVSFESHRGFRLPQDIPSQARSPRTTDGPSYRAASNAIASAKNMPYGLAATATQIGHADFADLDLLDAMEH